VWREWRRFGATTTVVHGRGGEWRRRGRKKKNDGERREAEKLQRFTVLPKQQWFASGENSVVVVCNFINGSMAHRERRGR